MNIRNALTVVLLALVLGLSPVLSGSAQANKLDDAKAAGIVGELGDGYLGAVDGAPAKATKLADYVNTKRREKYEEIAQKNNTTVDAVAAIAGQKLVQRAKPGEYVMDASGQWKQK